jgi:hypothetical protein
MHSFPINFSYDRVIDGGSLGGSTSTPDPNIHYWGGFCLTSGGQKAAAECRNEYTHAIYIVARNVVYVENFYSSEIIWAQSTFPKVKRSDFYNSLLACGAWWI